MQMRSCEASFPSPPFLGPTPRSHLSLLTIALLFFSNDLVGNRVRTFLHRHGFPRRLTVRPCLESHVGYLQSRPRFGCLCSLAGTARHPLSRCPIACSESKPCSRLRAAAGYMRLRAQPRPVSSAR